MVIESQIIHGHFSSLCLQFCLREQHIFYVLFLIDVSYAWVEHVLLQAAALDYSKKNEEPGVAFLSR